MKIDLMFYELTVEEAHRLTQCVAEMPEPIEEVALPEPKRKRRTKAEMAEARAEESPQETEDPQDAGREETEDDPPTPRRRQRGGDNASAGRRKERASSENPTERAATAGQRSRKKTRPLAAAGTAKSPSDDEISDADVAKAASEGAQRLTPKVVTGILEEFGVSNVAELSQEQRREFMKALDDYVAY